MFLIVDLVIARGVEATKRDEIFFVAVLLQRSSFVVVVLTVALASALGLLFALLSS
mgnify:FL=1